MRERGHVVRLTPINMIKYDFSHANRVSYIHLINKQSPERVEKMSKNGFSETRVRIEKQSKVREIAAPTINPRSKVYPQKISRQKEKIVPNPTQNIARKFQH